MPGGRAEFTVSAAADSGRGWLVVELESGGIFKFFAALTVFPRSRISQDLLDFLLPMQLATPVPRDQLLLPGDRYVLRDLTMYGNPVLDTEVRVGAAISRLPVHAILGMDFLQNFDDITLNPIYSTLTFIDP